MRSPNIPWIPYFVSSFATAEDPDVEDAPVVPEIGTIEVRAYRCQSGRLVEYQHRNHRLNEGRVSERSKKAGWHHVRYFTSRTTRPILIRMILRTQYRRRGTQHYHYFSGRL